MSKKFTMVGYQGVVTKHTQIGFREIENGRFRVQVKLATAPRHKLLARSLSDWNVDTDEDAHSISTIAAPLYLTMTLKSAVGKSLALGGNVMAFSDEAPDWFRKLVAETNDELRKPLIKRVRFLLKLPGANAASRWTYATLLKKIARAVFPNQHYAD